MILADTSIWVEHLRATHNGLQQQLASNRICVHPMIIGELSCGNLRNRTELLFYWQQMPQIKEASHDEVLYSINTHQWMGKGIGFVDAHLLSSTLLNPNTKLWTLDARLHKLAESLGVAFVYS